jgi:hypothetical protein
MIIDETVERVISDIVEYFIFTADMRPLYSAIRLLRTAII